MLNSVSGSFPGTATVSIYNAADDPIVMTGIKLMKSGDDQCASFSGTLAAGGTTSVTCTVTEDEGLYLADIDGDNSGSSDIGADSDSKEWIIDGVCFNDGSGSDAACDGSSDAMIAAGVWGEDTYVTDSENDGVRLIINGNNDEAVSDWEAIPEFSTLLMPIVSVLMIVGYNYRRKNLPEA